MAGRTAYPGMRRVAVALAIGCALMVPQAGQAAAVAGLGAGSAVSIAPVHPAAAGDEGGDGGKGHGEGKGHGKGKGKGKGHGKGKGKPDGK